MLILAIIIGKYPIRSANYEIRGISSFWWFLDDAELAEYKIHPHKRIQANDLVFVSIRTNYRSGTLGFGRALRTTTWDYVRIQYVLPRSTLMGARGESRIQYGQGIPTEIRGPLSVG